MTEQPPPPDLAERVHRLELQAGTIIWLSAVNLFLNLTMLLVGFLLGAA
jgi:hypothetical protein